MQTLPKLSVLFIASILLFVSGCDDTKNAGNETAREITGANTIERGKELQERLHQIDSQQQKRLEELEQQ